MIMNTPARILMCSLILAIAAEVALILNWRILAPHIEADAGVFTMVWVWPLSWVGLVLLAALCLVVERMNVDHDLVQGGRRLAVAMVMRLSIPMLLLVGPGIILLYAVVMVLMAAGVTAPEA